MNTGAFSNLNQTKASMSQANVFDVQALKHLKYSKQGDANALKETASQFESLFLKQLLSSMRKVNEVFQKDSLFNSQSVNFYQGMLDEQMAVGLSAKRTPGGIADLLLQQFSPKQASKSYNSATSLTPHKDTSVHRVSKPKVVVPEDNFVKQLVKQKELDKTSQQQSNELSNTKIEVQQERNWNTDFNTQKTDDSKIIVNDPNQFSSPKHFVDYLMPLAKDAAKLLNISPQVLIAQAALETGWGKHIIQKFSGSNDALNSSKSSNNLFNIKSNNNWNGESVSKATLEFDGNSFNKEQGHFRVYDSLADSFKDFVNFLQSSERYQSVVNQNHDDKNFVKGLQQAGYATDPEYAKKIGHILDSKIISVLENH